MAWAARRTSKSKQATARCNRAGSAVCGQPTGPERRLRVGRQRAARNAPRKLAAKRKAVALDIPYVVYTQCDMWQIEEHRRVDKQLSGSVPVEVLKRYEKWKDIARLSGPQGLRAIKGFHDETLSGEWKGYRSSRLGLRWRVIYRVGANVLQIQVVHVTAHDYRKP